MIMIYVLIKWMISKNDGEIGEIAARARRKTMTQFYIDTEWQRIKEHLNETGPNMIKDKSKTTEKQMDFLVLNLLCRKEQELEIPEIV